jgi:hypothetical protein
MGEKYGCWTHGLELRISSNMGKFVTILWSITFSRLSLLNGVIVWSDIVISTGIIKAKFYMFLTK